MQNILVDGEGKLTAIIDWECVSAVPLWRACQLPELLEGRSRDEKPEKTGYTLECDLEEQEPVSVDALDNEGVNGLYWEHLLEYERSQLRKLFLEEMEKLQPDWIATMKTSTVKMDLEKAVHNCDNGWRFKAVKRWLDAYMAGGEKSLAGELPT
jgi:hypothetical protein